MLFPGETACSGGSVNVRLSIFRYLMIACSAHNPGHETSVSDSDKNWQGFDLRVARAQWPRTYLLALT